jgi:hypothetical protein
MGKNQSASNLTNIIKQDANGSIAFMSGSTMLMALSNTGQMSGSVPVLSASTASFVQNAQSASYVLTAQTASFVANAQSASFVATAQTASFVALAVSASNAVSAQTASYANTFIVGSTLTAQTLVVQTITSSVDFVTGSTRFGSLAANTHTFTGSVLVSGSNFLIGNPTSNGFRFKVSNNGAEEWALNPGDSSNINNHVNYNRNTSAYIGANYLAATHSFLQGNVGIGTINPLSILHTSFTNSTAPTSGTTPSGIGVSFGSGNGYNGGIWFSAGFGDDQGICGIAGSRVSNYDTDLRFYTNNTNSARAFSERMRINSSGNVGIGTTDPGHKLDVSGTGRFNSNLIVNNSGGYSNNGYALNIESNSWAIVDANVKRQMQRVLGYVGDYEQHVILLHPIYNGSLIEFNKCTGTIHATRGWTYAGRINDTYEVDTSTGYDSYSGMLRSNSGLGKLYTCLYGGIKYLALIPQYRTSAVVYHFDGYISSNSGGETLKLITYRNSNTGTVVNSEIYNSLTAYTENDTFINGLFYPRQGIRFASGATTLNYYEEGSFTATNIGSNMSAVTPVFGKYVRIGNQVTVNVRWTVSPGGTGQKYFVFHLPFAFDINTNIGYTGAVSNYNNGLSAYSSNVGTTVRNSSGSDTQQYVEAVFTTNADTTMHLSMTYFTF